MKKITLQLGKEDLLFARRLAAAEGYSDTQDCLNGLLRWALSHWREFTDNLTPEQREIRHLKTLIDRQDTEIRVLKAQVGEAIREALTWEKEFREVAFGECDTPRRRESGSRRQGADGLFEEDPGGGVRLPEDDDLDDEIPF